MSELINTRSRYVRHDLLISSSALALAAALWISSGAIAASEEKERPTVWIELGGQLERFDSAHGVFFAPSFFDKSPAAVVAPMINAQQPPHNSIGGEGKITFAPNDSDWLFSASVRYGRSNASKQLRYQTHHTAQQTLRGNLISSPGRPVEVFGDGNAKSTESHFFVDFTAGKDVGLGMFGAHGKSVVSAGVRFAQFTSRSDVQLLARPEYHPGPILSYHASTGFGYRFIGANFHNYSAVLQAKRSTQAIGPTLSWDASAPILGDNTATSVAIDWGVNAAVLFGRQRARIHQQTTGASIYEPPGTHYVAKVSGYTNNPPDQNRSRSVLIPNVGGFAAVSFRYSSAMVKFGYRGDFFFNAVDNGIDARRSKNEGFYGPFAAITIGLGG